MILPIYKHPPGTNSWNFTFISTKQKCYTTSVSIRFWICFTKHILYAIMSFKRHSWSINMKKKSLIFTRSRKRRVLLLPFNLITLRNSDTITVTQLKPHNKPLFALALSKGNSLEIKTWTTLYIAIYMYLPIQCSLNPFLTCLA